MKTAPAVTVCCTCVVFCCACEVEPAPVPTTERFFPLDAPSKWQEVRGCRFSIEHPTHIRVFADAVMAAPYKNAKYPLPAGGVVVKGEYEDEKCSKLARFTAMRKRDDGGWDYQQATAEGKVEVKSSGCASAGCHGACAATDSVCTKP
jgi:hypothetical protein